MKILIISHMYPSGFDEINGIFVHKQVKELKKQGCEVIVVSPVPYAPFPVKYLSKKWKKYSQIPKKAILEDIEIYYPRYLSIPKNLFFASSGIRMYLGVKKTIAEIYKNFVFDCIHSHVALPDGYAGMMIAKKYKKPLIVTIHGGDLQYTIFKNKKCKKNIEKVINFSKKTIVVSNKLKKNGEKELNILPNKTIVIPNGIDIKDIYKGKSNLIKQYEDKKIILSISHLHKIKGIDYNIKAIAKLINKHPDLVYLIIGDGQERKNLAVLAKSLNIADHVKFLGQLTYRKTMEYLSVCNIFSMPSWDEGFGIVYIEAMAHRKPVIAIRGQGINDIIEDKKNGLLVEPKNTNSLIKALDFLLSSPEIAKNIGQEARKIVLENYTWKIVVKKMINVYNLCFLKK